ncbi:Holliday junction branch migration protein RuvA [filamentous cyanobacterium CCP5]|nr:Holliday junction branch migration protein RuvA [filamentous cyanobacterium CCP5]
MISYLKGNLVDIQKPGGQRIIVTLDVNQVGYDLQVAARILPDLPPLGEPVQLFSHQQIREDQVILFGFGTRQERELFRLFISVSGIGPQMAMALIDTFSPEDLVQAVVSGNTRLLSRTPGVGGKTAERIVLELKTKLSDWRHQSGIGTPVGAVTITLQEDVEMTLLALGYTSGEILQAIQAVGQSTTLRKSADSEAWVREAISWLSQ